MNYLIPYKTSVKFFVMDRNAKLFYWVTVYITYLAQYRKLSAYYNLQITYGMSSTIY